MMNDTNILAKEKLTEVKKLQSTNKEAQPIILPVEKALPASKKEIPVSKWLMPPEQHGYIQANDKDCL